MNDERKELRLIGRKRGVPSAPEPLAEARPVGIQQRVLDELDRLQQALWDAEAHGAELREALQAALPLLVHAVHEGCDTLSARRCHRCSVRQRMTEALARVPVPPPARG